MWTVRGRGIVWLRRYGIGVCVIGRGGGVLVQFVVSVIGDVP